MTNEFTTLEQVDAAWEALMAKLDALISQAPEIIASLDTSHFAEMFENTSPTKPST